MSDAEMSHWMTPILLIPGIALLTISTANRINAELLSLRAREIYSESSRLKYLRLALTCLYFGITVNAIAGLIGGMMSGIGAIELLAFPRSCQRSLFPQKALPRRHIFHLSRNENRHVL